MSCTVFMDLLLFPIPVIHTLWARQPLHKITLLQATLEINKYKTVIHINMDNYCSNFIPVSLGLQGDGRSIFLCTNQARL